MNLTSKRGRKEKFKRRTSIGAYRGSFVKLVHDKPVVELVEFETTDPALRGEMTITTTLVDADGGTDVLLVYEGLPRGATADNERGTRMALAKFTALVEAG